MVSEGTREGWLIVCFVFGVDSKRSLIGYCFADESFVARHNHACAFAMSAVTISTCLIACLNSTCVAEGSASMHIS